MAPRARFRPTSAAAWRTWSRPLRDLPGLLLPLLLAACGGRPASPSPRVLLSDADVRDLAAILRLEDRRQLDTVALSGYARSATPEVRRRAYLAAGRIGGPGAPALLRAGLRDSLPAVRAAAAFGAGMVRDTGAVEALGRLALAPAGEDAAEAAFALGRIGTPAARAGVMAVLGLGRAGPSTGVLPAFQGATQGPAVARALLAIWRFPRDSFATGAVRRYGWNPDTALRWRATYALMRMGDPAAVPDLLRLARDPYAPVRALAARGLRAVVADSAGQRAPAQAALTAALADPDAHVRIEALRALAGYRDPALVGPLAARLQDPDANVALTAADALGASRQPAAAAPLTAVLNDAARPLAVRGTALGALVRLDPAAGVAAARAWTAAAAQGTNLVVLPQAEATPAAMAARPQNPVRTTGQDSGTPGAGRAPAPAPPLWRTRWYAALALGNGRWAEVGAPLQALARDPDPRVVTQALVSMTGLFGDTLAPPRALLVEKLADADPFVRAAAIGVLAARVEPGNAELYLDSYARAAGDTADDAARAAVDALGALAKRDSAAARAFFTRFHRSSDPVLRADVVRVLGPGWGAVAPVETGRELPFYEDLVRRYVQPVLAGAPAPRARIRTRTSAAGAAAVDPAPEGEIVLELHAADAPLTVDNFLRLVALKYFDGGDWHRVVPDFVAQDGDPRGDGNGGPGWIIRDELSSAPYLRGTLGMALSGADTGGSQWFLALSPQPHLVAGYTVFGHVTAGLDVMDRVLQDDPILAIEVVR